jgi:hypothetical protein
MKFLITTDEIDGFNKVYSLDENKFINFPDLQYFEPNPVSMNHFWVDLPFEITLKIINNLIDSCMFETSFIYANGYIFISKTVLKNFCFRWMKGLKPTKNYRRGITAVKRTIFFTSVISDLLCSPEYRLCKDTYFIQLLMNNIPGAAKNAGPWDLKSLSGIKRMVVSNRSFNPESNLNEPLSLFTGGCCMKDSFAVRGKHYNGIFEGVLIKPLIMLNVVSKYGLTIFDSDFCKERWKILSNILKKIFGPYTHVLMICNTVHENPFVIDSVLVPF